MPPAWLDAGSPATPHQHYQALGHCFMHCMVVTGSDHHQYGVGLATPQETRLLVAMPQPRCRHNSSCCLQLLNELYHEDKGFNNSHTIFLSERPPSHDIEHVIATHEASRKLQYLQGSPFRAEVGPAATAHTSHRHRHGSPLLWVWAVPQSVGT